MDSQQALDLKRVRDWLDRFYRYATDRDLSGLSLNQEAWLAEPSERYPSCHCSVIAELDNAEILVGYYAGSGEAKPDAAWVLARKRPQATKRSVLGVLSASATPAAGTNNAAYKAVQCPSFRKLSLRLSVPMPQR